MNQMLLLLNQDTICWVVVVIKAEVQAFLHRHSLGHSEGHGCMVERFHWLRGKEEPHVLIEMKDEGGVGDRKEGVYC